MVARIYTPFRRNTQTQWINELSLPGTNLYLFIGKSTSWPDDSNPPTPNETVQDFYDNYTDMLAVKKIAASDVTPVVKRYDWVSGITYDKYDSTDPNLLTTKQFYVKTDNHDVYKCLYSGGVPSTVKPTGTLTSNIVTGDGYIWKYMYTLDSTAISKFLTANWMPVLVNSAVVSAAVDGSLSTVDVITGGAGYVSATVNVTSSTGSGGAATAVIVSGVITKILITNPGYGYKDVTITITSASGSGATATASIAPFGGHGADAAAELGCRNCMTVSTLTGNEGGVFPVGISYRKIGLLLNPLLRGTSTLATGTTYVGSALEIGSGEQLYIENRKPIARSADQNELYKFVLYF